MKETATVSPLLGWALWVSEVWDTYGKLVPCPKRRLYARARGIVVYDRVLNMREGVLERWAQNRVDQS